MCGGSECPGRRQLSMAPSAAGLQLLLLGSQHSAEWIFVSQVPLLLAPICTDWFNV